MKNKNLLQTNLNASGGYIPIPGHSGGSGGNSADCSNLYVRHIMKNNWKNDFRKAFGIYWSKQGNNAYIADPINNTRPIILSQEAVESYIDSLLAEQKKELIDYIHEHSKEDILTVLESLNHHD